MALLYHDEPIAELSRSRLREPSDAGEPEILALTVHEGMPPLLSELSISLIEVPFEDGERLVDAPGGVDAFAKLGPGHQSLGHPADEGFHPIENQPLGPVLAKKHDEPLEHAPVVVELRRFGRAGRDLTEHPGVGGRNFDQRGGARAVEMPCSGVGRTRA